MLTLPQPYCLSEFVWRKPELYGSPNPPFVPWFTAFVLLSAWPEHPPRYEIINHQVNGLGPGKEYCLPVLHAVVDLIKQMLVSIMTIKGNSEPSKNPAQSLWSIQKISTNQGLPHPTPAICLPLSSAPTSICPTPFLSITSHSSVSHLQIIFLSYNHNWGRASSVIKTMLASISYQLRKLLTPSTIMYSNPVLQKWLLGLRREGVVDLLRLWGSLERKSVITPTHTMASVIKQVER